VGLVKKIKLKPIFWIRLGVITLIVGVTIGIGYRYPEVTREIQKIFSAVSIQQSELWTLEKITVFKKCRHQTVEQSTFASIKALKDFVMKHPQWETVGSGPTKFQTIIEVHDFCSDCQQYQFLGIKSGKVVIMRGTPAKPGPVIQAISMDVQLLPEAEREDLQRGIPFKDEKEKLQLIEGLNGLILN